MGNCASCPRQYRRRLRQPLVSDRQPSPAQTATNDCLWRSLKHTRLDCQLQPTSAVCSGSALNNNAYWPGTCCVMQGCCGRVSWGCVPLATLAPLHPRLENSAASLLSQLVTLYLTLPWKAQQQSGAAIGSKRLSERCDQTSLPLAAAFGVGSGYFDALDNCWAGRT
jgi:hypothetical protein